MSRTRPSPSLSDSPPEFSWWDILLVALFLIRFFIPAEGSDLGQNLWIAAVWLLVATVRSWWLWRNEAPFQFRWNGLDLAVGGLVAGHVLSGAVVLFTTGDKRATLNCLFDWLSLAATWGLLRHWLRHEPARRLLSGGILISIVVLTFHGLWQYSVVYPRQGTAVEEFNQLLEKQERRETLSRDEQQSFERLRREVGADLLGRDAAGRRQMIDRIARSVEPIGQYALANSFGAILGMGLILFLDQLWRIRGSESRRPTLILLTAIGLIGFCLLLTKSRSAWVGTFCGLLWYGGRTLLSGGARGQQVGRWLFKLGAVGAVLIVAAWLTGGLDREVLSEAKKSLGYRLEYWESTWALIKDHPWLGVGPGNFRPAYLQYKLPGASEEILDPHNLVLDVWANGGLLALAGLGCLIAVLVKNLWTIGSSPANGSSVPMKPVCLAGLLALVIVFLEQLFFHGHFDETVLVLMAAFVAVGAVLTGLGQLREIAGLAAVAACAALSINLLAAGGIAMPAFLQLWLALLWMAEVQMAPASEASPASGSRRGWGICSILCALATWGCLQWGFIPSLTTQVLIERGRQAAIFGGRDRDSAVAFQEAADADPIAPEPRAQLANLAYSQWVRSGKRDAKLFDTAVKKLQAAIERDPHSGRRYRLLGEWWLERYEATHEPSAAEAAVQALQQAAELYPNDAATRATLALALNAAGLPSQEAAQVALQLDDLNIARGHLDRWLPKETREKLDRLASPASDN